MCIKMKKTSKEKKKALINPDEDREMFARKKTIAYRMAYLRIVSSYSNYKGH